MLKRRRLLLRLLANLGGDAESLRLMKLCYLVGREPDAEPTFYRFVPYHYGPYSFTMRRELDALLRDGFVRKVDEKTWALTPQGRGAQKTLDDELCSPVDRVSEKYGSLSTTKLVDHVYDSDPFVGLNTKLRRRARPRRPKAAKAIYTVGYEKVLVEDLLNVLLQEGVAGILDVRRNPVSRRYGFHRSTLSRLCENVGLSYEHLPRLGIDGRERRELNSLRDYQKLFVRYEATTLKSETEELDRALDILRDKPMALLCAEADPAYCHRGCLAEKLAELSGLDVVHLAWPRNKEGRLAAA